MPTGFTTVSGSHLQDATGTTIANATISFAPVDNSGNPISFRSGGAAGQVISRPVTAVVAAGVFSISVADTALTTPLNIGYRVTVTDNVSGEVILARGYECVQPTGSAFSFDSYTPNFAPQVTIQTGPQGPPVNFRGAWNSAATYALGDTVNRFDSSYISLAAGNVNHDPATDTTNWAALALGANTLHSTTPVSWGAADASFTSTTSSTEMVGSSTPLPATGLLTSLSITLTASSGGPISLLVLDSTDGANFTVDRIVALTAPASAGVATFTGASLPLTYVNQGQYLAVYRGSTSLSFAYKSGVNTLMLLNPGSPYAEGATFSWTTFGSGLQLGIAATVTPGALADRSYLEANYDTSAQTTASIAAALATFVPQLPQPRTQLWSESFAGISMPSGWTANAGAWTVSSGLLSPTDTRGYPSFLYFSRQYALDQLTMRVAFEVLASGTVLGFGSASTETAYGANCSLVTVDASAGTLNIASQWSPGATPTIATGVPLGFSIVTGQIYKLVVTISGRTLTATIGDPITGIMAVATSTNGTWGDWQDSPTFVGIAGQFKIHNLTVLADQVKPDVVILGDSIAYGVGVTVAQRWANLLGTQLSSFMVSGRPGGTSTGVLARITNEVAYLLPKHVIVAIGSNDASRSMTLSTFETNINSIISAAQGLGCVVTIGMITPKPGAQSTINTFNTFLAGLTGVGIVRFDRATSVGNDGSTQNAVLFQGDQTHPLPAGDIAMAARFLVDTPEIFD